MKRFVVKILLIGFVLTACQKIKYKDESYPNCQLCHYASQWVGNYRGPVTGVYVLDQLDTINVSVEQIFLGLNTYEDSTIMCFKMTYVLDKDPTYVHYDTIQIESYNGEVMNKISVFERFSSGKLEIYDFLIDMASNVVPTMKGTINKL